MELVLAVMILGIAGATFLFVGWILWLVSRHRRERQQQDVEFRTRMLEKFGNSEEFVGFMQTDAGKRFLETAGGRTRKSLKAKVISSFSTGIILLLLGGGFLVLARIEGDTGLMFPAVILSAIGFGSVITAVIYFATNRGLPDEGEEPSASL